MAEMKKMGIFVVPEERRDLCTRMDSKSMLYLDLCNMANLGRPVIVSSDGNCLFDSVALAMCGNLEMSTELRVRTSLLMIVESQNIFAHPKAKLISMYSPDFTQSVVDCYSGGPSSMWTVIALAEVIGMAIRSVYPPVNGENDVIFKELNMVVVPNNQRCDKVIKVMWTKKSEWDQNKYWIADHFVPLL